MKTITLRVGDKLEALVDEPFNAPIPKGGVCLITDFTFENDSYSLGDTFAGKAPKVAYDGNEWHTNVKDLFHKFKKVGGK